MNGSLDDDQPKFGHAMKPHFLFDPKYTNLNHGSYGTYPLPVRNAIRGYQKLAEYAPDKFIRYQTPDLLKNSRIGVARLLNVPADECVFVPNATTAINLILRNLIYEPSDVIIYFDTIYGALEKTLASLMESTPNLQVRKVGYGQDFAYSLPCTHPEILNAFSQTISRLFYDGLKPKVAIFDTIVSLPGLRFPYERLTKMCKEYGILSVVDGAHGIGQIPINLSSLNADFFVSNCHKWLYTPRGCAVLHIPPRNHHLIRTTFPTSHGFTPNPKHPSTNEHFTSIRNVFQAIQVPTNQFQNLFQYGPTTDNSPYYCVPAALKFRNDILGGEEAIYTYIRDVAQRGADLLAMILGTEVMDDLDPGEGLKAMGSVEGQVAGRDASGTSSRWQGGLRDCAMANVLLPLTIIDGDGKNSSPQGRGSLRSGPGGAGSAGGLSPFGLPIRRSPSPVASGQRNALTPTAATFSFNGNNLPNNPYSLRSPSLTLPSGGGHGYSKSSAAALPGFSPSRSPSTPLPSYPNYDTSPSPDPTKTLNPSTLSTSITAPNLSNPTSTSSTSMPPPSLPLQMPKTRRQISPNSPLAPFRRSSASPLRATIHARDLQKHIAWMERTLVEEHNTFVPIYEYKGRLWTRVCGQVYLEVRDFEWLGSVLRRLCERVGDGESLTDAGGVGGAVAEEEEEGGEEAVTTAVPLPPPSRKASTTIAQLDGEDLSRTSTTNASYAVVEPDQRGRRTHASSSSRQSSFHVPGSSVYSPSTTAAAVVPPTFPPPSSSSTVPTPIQPFAPFSPSSPSASSPMTNPAVDPVQPSSHFPASSFQSSSAYTFGAATGSASQKSEVERLRERLGALDTSVGTVGAGSGSGVRRFDVRVGRWVDG